MYQCALYSFCLHPHVLGLYLSWEESTDLQFIFNNTWALLSSISVKLPISCNSWSVLLIFMFCWFRPYIDIYPFCLSFRSSWNGITWLIWSEEFKLLLFRRVWSALREAPSLFHQDLFMNLLPECLDRDKLTLLFANKIILAKEIERHAQRGRELKESWIV